MDSLEFTANFNPTDYAAVVAAIPSTGDIYYKLEFGENGSEGNFTWTGTHSVHVNGGDVNAVREMTISVIPSSAITYSAT